MHRTSMSPRSLVPLFLLAVACATAPTPPTPPPSPTGLAPVRFLRLHLDEAQPGAVPELLSVRREYRGWVQRHAASPGEVPVLFVQLGEEQVWALRAASTWEEIPAQAAADRRTDDLVRAAVGSALEENGRRMHGSIRAHRNEILRLVPELSAGEPSLRAIAAQLVLVVVDIPTPARSDEYEAQAEKLVRGQRFHLVLLSSPGSGAFVHLLGAGEGRPESQLPDGSLVRSRSLWHALPHPELSALPPER